MARRLPVRKLDTMLKTGASQPWQNTLKGMTGVDHLDATPLLEYFAPLYAWLKEQNKAAAAITKSRVPHPCDIFMSHGWDRMHRLRNNLPGCCLCFRHHLNRLDRAVLVVIKRCHAYSPLIRARSRNMVERYHCPLNSAIEPCTLRERLSRIMPLYSNGPIGPFATLYSIRFATMSPLFEG